MVDFIQRFKAQHPDDRNIIDSGSKETSECIYVNPTEYASHSGCGADTKFAGFTNLAGGGAGAR